VIGDFDPRNPTHVATTDELVAAGAECEWIATPHLGDPAATLAGRDGVLVSPGSPYASMDGALAAIRHAREDGIPLVGTCGGFQHLIVEIARDVLGIRDAEHAETSPDAPVLAVTPLACSLAGQRHPVHLDAGTRAAALYGDAAVVEPFFCSYGLNPQLEPALAAAGLRVTGRDAGGSARIVELDAHPFCIATLFVFQARAEHTPPHPLTAAFVAAARTRLAQTAGSASP
jgi:CTP synthase (UTP-ammonia lyase)